MRRWTDNPTACPRLGRAATGPRGRRAFTLVELLVVIAILALLLGMLLPSLARARRAAKVALCGTNLRFIGSGWEFYLQDHDDTFPKLIGNMQWHYGGKEPCVTSNSGWTFSSRPINPYMGQAARNELFAGYFRCPEDGPILDRHGEPSSTRGYTAFEYYGNSYMMNFLLLSRYSIETHRHERFRRTDVTTPYARTILTGDCQWYYACVESTYSAHFHNSDDRMNLVFLDGHVAFIQIERGRAATTDYSFFPEPVEYWDEEEQ